MQVGLGGALQLTLPDRGFAGRHRRGFCRKQAERLVAAAAPIEAIGFEQSELPRPVAAQAVKLLVSFSCLVDGIGNVAMPECRQSQIKSTLRIWVAAARRRETKSEEQQGGTGMRRPRGYSPEPGVPLPFTLALAKPRMPEARQPISRRIMVSWQELCFTVSSARNTLPKSGI